jgi:hypothetical protein
MKVVELRNYLLRPGATGDFIRHFERHFLDSQRDEGMYPLGQFAVEGEPDRFVWIRGFLDMGTRLRGLQGFYGGAFWLARRDQTNAMLVDHENVHLLRPLAPIHALTGSATPEVRASEPAGTLAARTGVVAVDFYRATPAALEGMVDRFERRVRPALVSDGHQVLGHFVAELRPNDYPRLSVIQDPSLLVVITAYRDRDQCTDRRRDWSARGPVVEGGLGSLLTADVATLYLRPTLRSLIRYQSQEAATRLAAS